MAQISPTDLKRRLALALVLPLALMSLLAGTLFWQVNRLTSVMQWVDHTDRVIAQANQTQKLLVDMETGLRGYLVTGNAEFLEPYEQARFSIDAAFDRLGRLVSSKRSQLDRLTKVRSLYQQWYRYAQQTIALRKRGGDYQSYAINAEGKQQMDAIRGQITAFIQTEEGLRETRTRAVQQTTQWLFVTRLSVTFGIGGILAFFSSRQLLAVAQSYGRALKSVQQQAEALRESEAVQRRSAQRLAGLHAIDRSILAAESLNALVHAALSQMRQLVPYQQAFVVLFDFETRSARVVAGRVNGGSNVPENASMPLDDFVPAEVLQHKTRYVEDMAAVESYPPALENLRFKGIRSCITVPLLVEENLIGELNLGATQTAAFTPEHQEIAEEVAAQLAIAIQQSNLREQLQEYAAELEQRVAERTAALQDINTELEAFTYSVSHDLRAPLRTMQGFTQALLEDYGDRLDSLGQDYAHYIAESAVQMDTLISDLLAYSRLSRADIQMQPVNLSRAISEALSELAVNLQEQQVRVTVEDPLPEVMAHRRTLIQVLTNLLANAIKFVAPGVQPQIRIWAEEREEETGRSQSNGGAGLANEPLDKAIASQQNSPFFREQGRRDTSLATPPPPPKWVRLWVEDNGIGIAPEYHDRIFRVFERLHGVETYPGTGIGLAIVRKGMDRMGGRVGVESQPDQGSRFWIELPTLSS